VSPVLQQFPYCTNASSSNHLAWNLFIKPVYFNTRTHGVISLYYQTSVGSVAQSVQRLAMGCTVRGSNPSGGEIFRTCPDRPWGPPSLLYNGYRVFPVDKERPGRDADPSPSSSAVSHERVELYLYSPYGPYSLYRASVCLYKNDLYLYLLSNRDCLL